MQHYHAANQVRRPGALRRRRFAQTRVRRVVRKPGEPTKAQREAHELSHIPREDWCEFCVCAKSVASPHREGHPDDKVGDVPTMGMDLAFMGQRIQPAMMPILVVKEDSVGEVNVHALESKAVTTEAEHKGQGVYMVRCVC